MTKLTRAEINNTALNNLVNIRAKHLIKLVKKQNKAKHTALKPADIIDPVIIKRALYNLI